MEAANPPVDIVDEMPESVILHQQQQDIDSMEGPVDDEHNSDVQEHMEVMNTRQLNLQSGMSSLTVTPVMRCVEVLTMRTSSPMMSIQRNKLKPMVIQLLQPPRRSPRSHSSSSAKIARATACIMEQG